ncbi:MAG: hypothetical protein OH319_01595 [Candidatus Parvarchaeota archaeon]|nr:hypothetical protein [Candidatus Jingweiarchaeum tengchongense]MCW1297735.1 hypothetical protein [Candidatus Jingweiarchaeum tengchongense]MCW1299745.1 hypothetical protein [Candidatus Jingweiarchaeum tengchongense]MCW1304284.1 hypothetical protein [Candidatus Jingweiarchaeum tengchongense]MCW1305311.1 hypothetical protein [Candidatus Jingweiarchaeum tengchongense]
MKKGILMSTLFKLVTGAILIIFVIVIVSVIFGPYFLPYGCNNNCICEKSRKEDTGVPLVFKPCAEKDCNISGSMRCNCDCKCEKMIDCRPNQPEKCRCRPGYQCTFVPTADPNEQWSNCSNPDTGDWYIAPVCVYYENQYCCPDCVAETSEACRATLDALGWSSGNCPVGAVTW